MSEIIVTEIIENTTLVINEVNETVLVTVAETVQNVIIEVAELGAQGVKGDKGEGAILNKIAGETIPSYTPVAIIDNLAYKLDASNVSHQFAFVGFSINGTLAGQVCIIQQIGELVLAGWGLQPNQHYLAGPNGTIVLNNNSATNFTKVIGYALNSNTLVIKDFSTILKTN